MTVTVTTLPNPQSHLAVLWRRPGWPERLAAYLATARRRPFAWGAHDCALFSAGAVEALTGTDLAAPYRGRYTTARGAARVLRRAGAGSLDAFVAGYFPRLPGPLLAQRGDLALVDSGTGAGLALGVVYGAQVLSVGPDGLAEVPLSAAVTAWRVP